MKKILNFATIIVLSLLCVFVLSACDPDPALESVVTDSSNTEQDTSTPETAEQGTFIERPEETSEYHNQPILHPGDPGYVAPPSPMPGD